MILLWRRLPVIVRAILTGGVAAAAGTIPWTLLVAANLKFASSLPWSVLVAAVYLWLFWRYVRGWGWPRSTAEARRLSLRANSLSGDVWGAALLAGGIGLSVVILLMRVMNRLVTLPRQQHMDLSQLPSITALSFLLMGSVVAGVVEEASLRGYMQGPIERRHGPLIAIAVTGSLFGFAHFTHPEVGLVLMPFYLAVAAVYGAVTWLTNSILPAMVLHAGGNVLGGIELLWGGQSEWQASASPAPLIWEAGTDASFWAACAAFLVVGAAAVWAYASLASFARDSTKRKYHWR